MLVRRIRRKSDGHWLGLGLGIQEKWLKSRGSAFGFCEGSLSFGYWLDKLTKRDPEEEYEVVEGKP